MDVMAKHGEVPFKSKSTDGYTALKLTENTFINLKFWTML